ncbi:type II toxin-antitoxin system VapC family toxin [uncultured Agrococcus sp.]|uniref:type II toxin-antitoxin system VapC family toxin n=1 Tax=uncultured Agrococcus sp. TaxID=382258 RepID=UPI0025FC2ACB|nr:type II toxin-antitoxin system VapC family toxin [uncultured Agrococcus sp.]
MESVRGRRVNGYLLDASIVSELIKRHPNRPVLKWLESEPETWLSALVIGELTRGAQMLSSRSPERAIRLERWIRGLRDEYRGRVLVVEEAVALRWASITSERTLPAIDGFIAATALEHGLTVATRNTQVFHGTGVDTHNPFGD